MVKRALIFIVVLSAITIIMSSCRQSMTFYSWKEFNIEIIDNSTTFGQEIIYLDVNKPISKTKLGFRIRPIDFNITSQRGTFGVEWNSCHVSKRTHSITSIVIKAIDRDVTSLFKGRLLTGWQPPELSIDELMQRFNLGGFCGEGFRREGFDLLLRDNSINLIGYQTFEITITFDDGIVLTQKTEELTLI